MRICTSNGREIARGLSRYAVVSLDKIYGQRPDEIAGIPGCAYGETAVYCGDLVML